MMRFVYVSDEYRQAWRTYVEDKNDQWETWPDDFKEELKFKLEEERRREREQKETEERRKQRMLKRRRIKQFGSAIVGGVFGVLFTALRNKKQSIKKKR